MNPFEVCRKGDPDQKAVALACGECGTVFHIDHRKEAENCCRAYDCKYCGTATKRYRLSCFECSQKLRKERNRKEWEKAEKVSFREAKGEYIFCPEVSRNGGFVTLEDLEEEMFDMLDDGAQLEDLPQIFFDTKGVMASVNADDMCQHLCDEYPDAYDNLVNIDMLQSMLNDWCGMQPVLYWEPDYSRAFEDLDMRVEIMKEWEKNR